MKKIKKLLVAVPLALTSALAFTGCGDHTHTLKLTQAVSATCDTAGNSAYYTCETCGKHYSDEAGVTEIAENSWVINKLGHLYVNAEDHDCNRGCGTIRETSSYNLWDGTVASALPAEVEGVITITTAEQLAKVAAMVNAGETFVGKTIKLGLNIDLDGRAWTPIGNSHRKTTTDTKKFMGTFDGDGHTIMGLTNVGYTPTDTREETDEFDIYNYGLFGYTENAVIKNLTVNATIDADATALKGDSVGAIVGFANGGLTIQNCIVNGTINGGFDSVAGLVGRAYASTSTNKLIIKDCINNADITAMFKAAGVLGFMQSDTADVTIDGCTNNGDIIVEGAQISETTYSAYVAGIVTYGWGRTERHSIVMTNNTNTGDLCISEYIEPTGVAHIRSYATVAGNASHNLTSSTNVERYDFTGNTNTGKVYVEGVETASHDVTGKQIYSTYNEADDLNGKVYAFNHWDGTVAAALPAEQEGVICITTPGQLAKLAAMVNAGNTFAGKTIKLENDIDLKNIEWTPIGYGICNYVGENPSGYNFSGVFDGQGHTISNLKISTFADGGVEDGSSAGVGLFGTIYMAEIKNVVVTNADVTGNHYVAVLVGKSVDSVIEDCTVTDSAINCVYFDDDESGDKAGIIVGHFAKGLYVEHTARIEGCVVEDCTVSADRDAGQVIGCLHNGATQEDNTAEDVTVTWNQSSADVPGYTAGNGNINNDIVGITP